MSTEDCASTRAFALRKGFATLNTILFLSGALLGDPKAGPTWEVKTLLELINNPRRSHELKLQAMQELRWYKFMDLVKTGLGVFLLYYIVHNTQLVVSTVFTSIW